MPQTRFLSAREAAERLGVSKRRVLALIAERRLPATQIGAVWAIRVQDLEAYRPLPAHRPRKTLNAKDNISAT